MRHTTFFGSPGSWTRLLRELALSMVVGAGIGALLWLSRPESPIVPQLALSAFMGFWIYLVALAALYLATPLLGRWRGVRRKALLAVVFFLAGVVAWGLLNTTLPWLTLGRLRVATGAWRETVAFAGGIAVVVGFAFSTYESLRRRLEGSIERLKEREFAERELETARAIQRRLLPPEEIETEGCRIAARNLAAHVVAGDFYDVFHLDGGDLGVVVADVAGKGIGASLLMASVKAMLPLVAADRGVAETLDAVNRKLVTELAPREFVALAYLRFRPATGTFELANAGLPDPYLLAAGAPRPLAVPGPRLPLGIKADLAYASLPGRLAPGERLLLLTDGLPEAPVPAASGELEPLGYARLEGLLADLPAAAPGAWLDALLGSLHELAPRLDDDWTALLLERPPTA